MEENQYSPEGKHITFDLKGIDRQILNDEDELKRIYEEAIEKSGATIREYQSVIFEPEGLTFTFILSESHASAHTYPSDGVLMGCIHTCGKHVDPSKAVNYIIEQLKPTQVVKNEIVRGVWE